MLVRLPQVNPRPHRPTHSSATGKCSTRSRAGYRLSATPNDGRFGELWGLSQLNDADIDATDAWDHETGDPSVIVAVVDSGVAYDHPDFAPNRWTNDDPPGNGDDDGNGMPDDTFGRTSYKGTTYAVRLQRPRHARGWDDRRSRATTPRASLA